MFDLFRSIVEIAATVFVVSAMLNVGLTQKLSDILGHLNNVSFVVKMLIANFVIAPLLMLAILALVPMDPPLRAGLVIFSFCAGAPFLIKLTQKADHDVALGAAVMMLLVLVTIVYAPLVLPIVLSGVTVNGWAIARSLLVQMLLPIVGGMLAVRLLPSVARRVQLPVGRLANVTLYTLLIATMAGYFPNMLAIVGEGAILAGAAFIGAAFCAGYLAGAGKDHLEDVGGLGTAQRNTAAGVVIAVENFTDPNVLVIVMLVNTLGLLMLMFIARLLRRDNPAEAQAVSAEPSDV